MSQRDDGQHGRVAEVRGAQGLQAVLQHTQECGCRHGDMGPAAGLRTDEAEVVPDGISQGLAPRGLSAPEGLLLLARREQRLLRGRRLVGRDGAHVPGRQTDDGLYERRDRRL